MAKVVEITTHFVDEESGISGYVANNIVYLQLGEDGVTKEEFLKRSIKYIGFNTTKARVKTFTDIYDDAQNQYTNVKVIKEVEESSERVEVPTPVNTVGVEVDVPETVEVSEEPAEEVEVQSEAVEESVEEPVKVDEPPVKQERVVGRRSANRKAKVKAGIKK
tara:strand:+ start:3073 stop:3561 length:489 start_codon:yes stop_codon:yes gene_type:complete